MSNAAILSIKPVYANQILAGTKTIELRKSVMGLSAGDVILVYSSAPEQRIGFWFRVKEIESLPVDQMWQRHHERLGIGHEGYVEYFSRTRTAVGFHLGELHPLLPVPLEEIQRLVPGFVPPQGIIWLRDEVGRYEKLLPALSDPLPKDIFSQQSLGFDLGSSRRRRTG
jgi:predicted transcriptional regulator